MLPLELSSFAAGGGPASVFVFAVASHLSFWVQRRIPAFPRESEATRAQFAFAFDFCLWSTENYFSQISYAKQHVKPQNHLTYSFKKR